jgi:hypothetical protein
MSRFKTVTSISSVVLLFSCGGSDPRGDGEHDSGILSVGETGTDSASSGPDDDDGNDDDGIKLDVGEGSDLGPIGCGGDASGGGHGGGEAEIDFSYIWIANSTEGTISKIDTQTMQEMGRYIVREDSAGSPSRTSVNMSGDVAVANRLGGVTKVFAVSEECPDLDGDGVITTSTGPDDVKPWGQDECVGWHTSFPTYTSQRPVAWAQGEFNPATCEFDNQMLWTSGGSQEGVAVNLLNGETGAVEQTVNIPELQFDGFGIYGAAVDGEGNFWGSQLGQSGKYLVFVDRETFQYKVWPQPIAAYGMTVDSEGYVWTCQSQVGRFDPETETWETAQTGGAGGCMADGQGLLWQAGLSHLTAVDTQTLDVVQMIPIEHRVHGVSIDFQGYVWGVTLQQPYAYRVDPLTGVIDTFTGLTGPYTYSDMTGFALQNAGTIPTPPA